MMIIKFSRFRRFALFQTNAYLLAETLTVTLRFICLTMTPLIRLE